MTLRSVSLFPRILAMFCALLLAPGDLLIYADPVDPAPQAASVSPQQLDSLIAPIALYPDSLLSQILVASTYPLEIVQAAQWLQQHPDLKGEELTSAAQQQNWDPSIQALVIFPDVMKRLTSDITWTTNLGNAFLAHQADVMDAVQRMRSRAEEAGKLNSTDQQKVENTTDSGQKVIEIQSTNPQVVYVPYYDPAVVWGPDYDYPYPSLYYPPGVVWGEGIFWFGTGIFLGAAYFGCCGWGGWGWRPYWHDHTVIVNNNFIHRYNFNSGRGATLQGQTVWQHDQSHRLGVAYPNRALSSRFQPMVRTHPTVMQVQGQIRASGARFQASGGAERFGSRAISPGVFNRNRSAFGGMEAGSAARVNSDRGFSSLGRARAAGGARFSGGRSSGSSSGGRSGGGSWGSGGHSGGGGSMGGGGGGRR